MSSKQSILSSYITQLQSIEQEKDYEYFFRGHLHQIREILPRIYRSKQLLNMFVDKVGPGDDDNAVFHRLLNNTIIENEDRIFKEIILRSPKDFANEYTSIEKLVKMQHYGLPTRLIDITSNPLVALYFACFDPTYDPNMMIRSDDHGEVIIFKIHKDEIKFFDSDTVSILANLSKMRGSFTLPPKGYEHSDDDKDAKTVFNESEDLLPLLHEIRNEKPQFSPVIEPKDFDRVLAVKVKLSNDRIVRQSGAFLLFGIKGSKIKPATINPKWISQKIVVSIHDKQLLLNELSSLGISENSLFPEIEYQAKYLANLYEVSRPNV